MRGSIPHFSPLPSLFQALGSWERKKERAREKMRQDSFSFVPNYRGPGTGYPPLGILACSPCPGTKKEIIPLPPDSCLYAYKKEWQRWLLYNSINSLLSHECNVLICIK